LGHKNKTQNGWIFWGLTKPPRRPSDRLAAVERAWERYRGKAEALMKDSSDANRSQLTSTIQKHAHLIENFCATVS